MLQASLFHCICTSAQLVKYGTQGKCFFFEASPDFSQQDSHVQDLVNLYYAVLG
jgi:hypothetical protein